MKQPQEASQASHYPLLQVIKDDSKLVNIRGKTVRLDYYESVYSPTVTASLVEVDSGASPELTKDTGIRGTLKDVLPIEGFEQVAFIIDTAFGELNYSPPRNIPFKVTGTPTIIEDGLNQLVSLNLVSQHEIDNAQTPIKSYFRGRINETVEKLLKELKIPESKLKDKHDPKKSTIEDTQNNEQVTGRSRSPFEIILDLCKKSIPVKGDPGFFFYQTQDGFHFKSIDTLINDGIKLLEENKDYRELHTYFYSPGIYHRYDGNNNFRILESPKIIKDQDVLESLENGTYSVRFITTNPYNFKTEEKIVNLLSKSNLGKSQKSNPNVDENNFHATYSSILDPGSSQPGVGVIELNNPVRWEALANMRYNLLHAQVVQIQVPCNINLKAGEVVRINLGNISLDNKIYDVWNQQRSGDYLILHLCHHFDPENSYTSMTLARDTYGLYKNSY